VNGVLQDVAKGHIIQPESRVTHTNKLAPHLYKVTLSRVLPRCSEVVPPFQLEGEDDDELDLEGCMGHILLWPKGQIRLGAEDTTPKTTTPVGPPAPRNVLAPDPDMMNMAQEPDEDFLDDFLNPDCGDDVYMQPLDQAGGLAKKPNCTTRLLFSS
jgi:hypothetical protein